PERPRLAPTRMPRIVRGIRSSLKMSHARVGSDSSMEPNKTVGSNHTRPRPSDSSTPSNRRSPASQGHALLLTMSQRRREVRPELHEPVQLSPPTEEGRTCEGTRDK